MAMKTLLIVSHSRTGGARQMAEAAADGARLHEVVVRHLGAEAVEPEDLLGADAYLFAAPENLAALSGAMKECLDRCYYPVLGRLNGRAYAAMICAGNDGTGAARQLARIVTGWRLREVAPVMIVRTGEAILAPKVVGSAELAACGALGETLAAGVAMGVF
jgi:multimeric flavodoxin WrbA